MVAGGITRREATVPLLDPRAAQLAASEGITRTAAAMRLAVQEIGAGAVWVVGNAPTALFELLERPPREPALVVGLPVGFVGAAEAKTALGRRGRGRQRAALLRRGRAVRLDWPDDALLATLPAAHRCLSSAVLGGGLTTARHWLNLQVPHDYARTDPEAHLTEIARANTLDPSEVIGMLTAADVRAGVRRDRGPASRSPPRAGAPARCRAWGPSTCSWSSASR